MKKEESLQIQICTYLKWQHPDLLWTTDLASGMRLTIGQAVKAKKMRCGRGLPDLMIFKSNKYYHGLFLELKVVTPFKKDGTLKSNEHLETQDKIHKRFDDAGYFCKFVAGFDEAIEIINCYMKDV